MSYHGGGGGGGGGAGNPGGGSIKLVASQSLVITGTLNASGTANSTGNAANGAAAGEWCGGNGGYGGSTTNSTGSSLAGLGGAHSGCESSDGGRGGISGIGAGGGIALICTGPFGIKMTGTCITQGGGGSTQNFGSIKIFDVKNQGLITGPINGGWNNVYGTPLHVENKIWTHVC
jgi:hypothetical protein